MTFMTIFFQLIVWKLIDSPVSDAFYWLNKALSVSGCHVKYYHLQNSEVNIKKKKKNGTK